VNLRKSLADELSQHNQQASQLLIQIKKNPNNPVGWTFLKKKNLGFYEPWWQSGGKNVNDPFLCRSTTNLNKRIELLESSVYKSLKTDMKEKMIRQPYAGLVRISVYIFTAESSGFVC